MPVTARMWTVGPPSCDVAVRSFYATIPLVTVAPPRRQPTSASSFCLVFPKSSRPAEPRLASFDEAFSSFLIRPFSPRAPSPTSFTPPTRFQRFTLLVLFASYELFMREDKINESAARTAGANDVISQIIIYHFVLSSI